MRIDQVDPWELDLDTADEIAALRRAGLRHVDVALETGPAFLLSLREGNGEPEDQRVLLARVDDRVVGWARGSEPRREYTDTLFVGGSVAPDRQRQGIGRALLEELLAGTTRTTLRTRSWDGSAGEQALPCLGFEKTFTSAVRRLRLDEPDPAWASLRRDAEAAAADYELVRRVGPTPEEHLPEMVVLREAINDAPDAVEFEAYPAERVAAYEQALTKRRQTQ